MIGFVRDLFKKKKKPACLLRLDGTNEITAVNYRLSSSNAKPNIKTKLELCAFENQWQLLRLKKATLLFFLRTSLDDQYKPNCELL